MAENILAGVTSYHALAFLGCWLGGIFDGMDSTLMSVVLPSAIGELTHHQGPAAVMSQVGGVITVVFLLGWTLGGIVMGWVGDRMGRLKAMVLSILFYSVFTGLSGLAQTWPQLAGCRFLTGLGIGGELVSIATFLAEIWPERSRALAMGCLITAYPSGVFLAGALHFICHNWRFAFGWGALPAVLVILLRLTLRESDRWVAATRRDSSSIPNDAPSARALLPKSRLIIGIAAFSGLLIGYWASLVWIPTWIQSLIPASQTELATQVRSMATMIQGFGSVVGCILEGWLCGSWGRRPTLIVSALGSLGASALLFNTHPVSAGFNPSIYWQNGLLGVFIGMLQAGCYIYLPELFVTRVRATATGICLNAGRLLTAGAVACVGSLVLILGGYAPAAMAFSWAYAISAIAVFLGPETRMLS